MSIRIITDSGSDIKQNQYKNVSVLPLSIFFDGTEYLDGVTIDAATFYQKLAESKALPKTSQVSPYKFEQAYLEAIKNGEDILVITVTSKLSGCYQSAVIASDLVDQKIYIIDSESVTCGQHALIKEALKYIEEGFSIEEVYEKTLDAKKKLTVYALIDTLEYLKKGGRISNIAALAGTMFSIKPVLTIENGLLEMVGKARGLKQGGTLLTRHVEKVGVDLNRTIIAAYSGSNSEFLDAYIEEHEDLFDKDYSKVEKAVIGPGIGTHAGPNAIAVAFFSK